MTRDRYQTRVAKFFDFAGTSGTTLKEKARNFANRGKDDINWTFSNILKYVHFQKERVNRKEITGATVRNYGKSIKLFCDMADIPMYIQCDSIMVRRMKAVITQIESVVTQPGNSGHVVVPKAWIGKEATVTLKENITKGKNKQPAKEAF